MLRSGFIWHEDDIPDAARLAIRTVLMTDWDPIGVNGIPEAADEYDSYVPKVYHLIITNASVAEIQHYLFEIVGERMGMSPPATFDDMLVPAQALKSLSVTPNS